MQAESRVYVAGHRGLVGSAIWRACEAQGFTRLIRRERAQLDLRDAHAVNRFFESERPEYVFLAAARVGGIHANEARPADFIADNLLIEANVIDAAWRHGARKLLFLGSSCIYPKLAPQPLREEYLLDVLEHRQVVVRGQVREHCFDRLSRQDGELVPAGLARRIDQVLDDDRRAVERKSVGPGIVVPRADQARRARAPREVYGHEAAGDDARNVDGEITRGVGVHVDRAADGQASDERAKEAAVRGGHLHGDRLIGRAVDPADQLRVRSLGRHRADQRRCVGRFCDRIENLQDAGEGHALGIGEPERECDRVSGSKERALRQRAQVRLAVRRLAGLVRHRDRRRKPADRGADRRGNAGVRDVLEVDRRVEGAAVPVEDQGGTCDRELAGDVGGRCLSGAQREHAQCEHRARHRQWARDCRAPTPASQRTTPQTRRPFVRRSYPAPSVGVKFRVARTFAPGPTIPRCAVSYNAP